MKKLIIILSLILSATFSFAQFHEPCLPEGITFTRQTQIDSFPIYYPECQKIQGDVKIYGSSVINLDSLSCINWFGGQVDIFATSITDLSGLDNVFCIDSSLTIRYNDSLVSLSGIGSLDSIGSDLIVQENPLLNVFDGFEKLKTVYGNFTISYCFSLTEISGLDRLETIGGNLQIHGCHLPNLSGFNNLKRIGEDLVITYNNSLNNLSGLENLTSIGGNLSITNNVILSDCEIDAVCGYLSDPPGVINIYHNAGACEGMIAVMASCGITLPCPEEGTLTLSCQSDVDYFPVVYSGCDSIGASVSIRATNLDSLYVLTSIGGDLDILKNGSLSTLSGLENLISVGGDFNIGGNGILTGFSGLENLISIGGNLSTYYSHSPDWGIVYYIGNALLVDFSGLNNLQFIGGDFEIIDNKSLNNLTGLENLDTIQGGLVIGHNYSYTGNISLTSLEGIDNLDYIGGKLSIVYNDTLSECEAISICNYLSDPQGSVEIHHNAPGFNNPSEVANACGIDLPCLPFGNYYLFSQTDIDNFQSCYPGCSDLYGDVLIYGEDITNLNELSTISSIEGTLDIHGNPLLTTLSGLDNLSGIGGGFVLGWPNGDQGNPQLNSIEALYNLQSIGGDFEIIQNSRLPNLNGLIGLTKVGGRLKIEYNDSLIYLSGLNNLTSSGSTDISYNSMLTSLEGLEKLDSTGSFYIYGNRLLNIIAMDNLFHIDGSFDIINNDALTSLTGLNNLNYVKWSIRIEDNDSLKTISGLNGLSAIGRALAIKVNTNLQEITGLNNLSHLGGLVFDGNPNLVDLSGLQNIDSVGYLIIKSNDALTSLEGLKDINSINGNLRIVNNPLLAYCEIQAICDYLENPPAEIEILDNAPGCNTEIEIQHACWEITIVDDKTIQDQITFYPNPVTANAKLSGEFASSKIINICIYNTTGLCLKSWEFASQQNGKQEFNLNLGELPRGIYFLRLQAGNEVVVKKVVKL